MYDILKKTYSPLISLFIFTLGSALCITLGTIRLHNENASTLIIGLMSTAYYLGLVLGSFRIERFIVRVGHIRAFAAFAPTLAVTSLIQGLIMNAPLWIILRLIAGFTTAGLFIVIESWLLIESTINTRGRILAIYMVALYAAQAFGQLLINTASTGTITLFAIVSMLASASVIPLAMTSTSTPEFSEPSTLSFKALYRISPTGVIGCFCAGLVLSAIYGLIPLYVAQSGQDISYVAHLMFFTICGGMALQYPVGRLSDTLERRVVLILLAFIAVLLCAAIIATFGHAYLTPALFFLFGGCTFTLYPISISHACDSLQPDDIVASTQGLLLSYSVGATVGPAIAPAFMGTLGRDGLFIYFIFITLFMTVFFSWRKTQQSSPTAEDPFVPIPHTTPILAELDPRSEEPQVETNA